MGLNLKDHNTISDLMQKAFSSDDSMTVSGINHRKLTEKDTNKLCEYMESRIKNHHISEENYKIRRDILNALSKEGLATSSCKSPYPVINEKTRKGNYAEILMAEYLQETTEAKIPIYRLRYNPNPEQAMKGDDVLLFDLDSTPVRIIIGEAKFRKTPDKAVVDEAIEGLMRARDNVVPVSLFFVAETLRAEGKNDYADKIENCAILIAQGKVETDYVGLLLSNSNASTPVDKHTPNTLHNLLMISVAMHSPENVVKEAFDKVENEYERI